MREAYEHYLIQIVFDFLFAHEYQHIEGGYTDWFMSLGDNMLYEFSDAELTAREALNQQVLEMDADAAAIRWSLKITIDRSNDHWRIPPALSDVMANADNRLFAWLFATGVLFRLMDEIGHGSQHFTRASHPPALMRMYFCYPAVDYILSDTPMMHSVSELIPVVGNEVETALRSITLIPPNAPGIADALTPEYATDVNKLVRHWRHVRKKLTPIAAKWNGSNAPDEYFELIPETK